MYLTYLYSSHSLFLKFKVPDPISNTKLPRIAKYAEQYILGFLRFNKFIFLIIWVYEWVISRSSQQELLSSIQSLCDPFFLNWSAVLENQNSTMRPWIIWISRDNGYNYRYSIKNRTPSEFIELITCNPLKRILYDTSNHVHFWRRFSLLKINIFTFLEQNKIDVGFSL